MIILKYFVNHNYYDLMALCCFCDDSLITLGWYVYDLGIMLGPLWGHIGLLFCIIVITIIVLPCGILWDQFGTVLGCGTMLQFSWYQFEINLRSFWDHFGTVLQSSRSHFRLKLSFLHV